MASVVDLKEIHAAYTRISDKFKTLWTFHQFLQGLHKTFFGNAPGYQVDFQALYDEIKAVTQAMTFQPPATVVDTINRLDLKLEAIHQKLSEDDRAISANYVRRFFEKVRTEDEKLLMAILRFYFYGKVLGKDTLDKVDFLLTLVGARRSLDDGRFMPRFPVELQKLWGSFLGQTRRNPVDPTEVRVHVGSFERIKREIEACHKFEDLTEKKSLEGLRAVKQRLGNAFFSAEVLTAMLETNLAAKNKFQNLYEQEEQRISESSMRLLEMERELERNPKLLSEEVQEELRQFKQQQADFEKEKTQGGVRHQDVSRLADSIDSLMARFEGIADSPAVAPPEPPAAGGAKPTTLDAMEEYQKVSRRPAIRTEVGVQSPGRGDQMAPAADAPSAPLRVPSTQDPLTSEQAAKVLFSIELIDEGTGTGGAAYGKELRRLRLEPWEVRASRRILREELPTEPVARNRDILLFESATLRMRIEEEARGIRALEGAGEVSIEKLAECGQCLMKAQEMDRRFRVAIEQEGQVAPPERLNELTRSRFRLLRSFSGLWLLHNANLS